MTLSPGALPLVSVIVPSYNRERYVQDALDSVRAQDYAPLELFIFDDASTDGSAAAIRGWLDSTRFPATFVQHERNQGLVAVLNAFLDRAHGKYVTWCPCDDVWLPQKLDRQVRILEEASEDVAAICGNCEKIDADGHSLGPMFDESFRFPDDPYPAILSMERTVVASPNCVLRRSAARALGGWNQEYLQEDFDFFLRLTRRYRMIYDPTILLQYRQVADSMGKNPAHLERLARDNLRIVSKQEARNDRERAAIMAGKANVLEEAYARACRNGASPRSSPDLQRLLALAGGGDLRQRTIASCIEVGLPFRHYWLGMRLVRRSRRMARRLLGLA